MDDLISVLIPAYNHEDYVQEAIRSIIAQTYQNIELLVIDDGSSDSTWEKICELREECEKRFVRVVFDTQENQGSCITLNRLLSLQQGPYTYLIASDDIAKPKALECLHREIETGKYVLVVGDNELIDADSNRISWDKDRNCLPYNEGVFKSFASFLQSTRDDVQFTSNEFGSYKSLLKMNYITNGYLCSQDAIKKIGGYTTDAPLEDWYMNLQLSKQGKFKFIDEILFSYRWHKNNTIKKSDLISNYMRKTLLYEEKIVHKAMDEQFINLFHESHHYQTNIFKLDPFIHLYKYRTVEHRRLILKIFNMKLTLIKLHV